MKRFLRIGLGIGVYLVVTVGLLAVSMVTYASWLLVVALAAVAGLMIRAHVRQSRRELKVAAWIVAGCLVVLAIPFPTCSSWGFFAETEQRCTCLGVQKYSTGVFDASWSQCIGIPVAFECRAWSRATGRGGVVPCR